MADTFTPNINLNKPEIGASDDTWGDKLNANADLIDAAFQTVLPLDGGTVTGTITIKHGGIPLPMLRLHNTDYSATDYGSVRSNANGTVAVVSAIPASAQYVFDNALAAPASDNHVITRWMGDGFAIDVDPATGSVSVRQGSGAGASIKPFTEGQSKDNVFATRAEGALTALDPIAGTLTSRSERAAEMVPFGLARGMQTDEFQVAQNAGDEFLQAILRKDTGAAITEQEQMLYGKTYLPQPGDSEAVMAQKQQARRRAVEAIKAGMSPAQMIAQEKALAASGSQELAPIDQPAPTAAQPDLSDDDLLKMYGG